MGALERALLLLLAALAMVVGVMAVRNRRPPTPEPVAQSSNVPAASQVTQTAPAAMGGGYTAAAGHVRTITAGNALAAPVRDEVQIRRTLERSAGATYLSAIVAQDPVLAHWPTAGGSAVRVWVQRAGTLRGWRGSLVGRVRGAFDEWSSVQMPVRFRFVSDSASAQVVVLWTERFADERAGSTTRVRDQHGWLHRAEITLALFDVSGAALEDQHVGAIALHEVGHALGLGHSPSAADIMSPRNLGVYGISRTDRATVALLYSLPPGQITLPD